MLHFSMFYFSTLLRSLFKSMCWTLKFTIKQLNALKKFHICFSQKWIIKPLSRVFCALCQSWYHNAQQNWSLLTSFHRRTGKMNSLLFSQKYQLLYQLDFQFAFAQCFGLGMKESCFTQALLRWLSSIIRWTWELLELVRIIHIFTQKLCPYPHPNGIQFVLSTMTQIPFSRSQ